MCFLLFSIDECNNHQNGKDDDYYDVYRQLLEQFITSIPSISRISEMSNHPMNNITQGQTILLLNSLQMFMVLNGGTEIEKYRFLAHKIM